LVLFASLSILTNYYLPLSGALAVPRIVMKIIDWFWKVLTLIIIGLLMLNPEFIVMSAFIDAVGLEMFSLLIEVQIISVVGFYFHNWIKPVLMPFYNYFKKIDPYFFIPTRPVINEFPLILCHIIPGFIVLAVGESLISTEIDLV
jgi:hypothetical protein